MLDRLLSQPGKGTFESRLTAAFSSYSAGMICIAYLFVLVDYTLEYGFIFDLEAVVRHLETLSGLFNSLWFIILVTLFSITSVIPGIAALFLGLVELKTRHGKKTALWGFFGFIVGTFNFYMIFKMIAPS